LGSSAGIISLILKHTFSPPSNTRLAHLCGPTDEHLRTIETALQVRIQHRHEQFKIDGHKAKAQRALDVLQALYEIAGRPISPDKVQLMVAGDGAMSEDEEGAQVLHTRRSDLKARTPNQSVYLDNIANHDITFGIGPAGTGKTYLAMALAVAALSDRQVGRIILTRPAVEAGERLGFLPGDMLEKVDPYLRPLYDALYDMLDPDRLAAYMEKGTIEVAPLAFMRGRTLNDSFIILDEAQNTSPEQMQRFLTRLGFGSRVVVTGDVTQIDLPREQASGLIQVQDILGAIDGIAFIRFGHEDVVRHKLVQRIVEAYKHHAEETGTQRSR
jgi:phosphate starvation-inducible PhoH-like protein